MPQKGFLDELIAFAADPRIGYAASEQLDLIIGRLSKHIDYPLRMFATATPNGLLNITASSTTTGDNATKISSPINAVAPAAFPASTVNFGTGAILGGGNVTLNGAAFATGFAALTKTSNQFRRFLFAQQQDGSVACVSSAEAASQILLTDYASLAASAGGTFIAYVDVQWISAATQYKTAGSATNVIENTGIFRNSVGGGGGSVSAALAVQSAATPNITLSSGFFPLSDRRTLASWDGAATDTANYAKTLAFNATTVLAASPASIGGGGAPANSTLYYVYIDLDALSSTPVTIATGTQANRVIYTVQAAQLVIGTAMPTAVNGTRYIHRGSVMTTAAGAWSGTNAELWASPLLQGNNSPAATSLIVSRPATGSVVSAMKTAGQIAAGHVITAKSFQTTLATGLRVWQNLNANALDGSGNGKDLTNNGTVPFTGTNIQGVAGAASFNGTTQSLSSTDAFYNPGTGKSFALGGIFAPVSWVPGTAQVLIGNEGNSTTDQGFYISISTTGVTFVGTNTGTTLDASFSVLTGFGANTAHHVAMVYDFSTLTLKGYIDGKLVGSVTLANQRSITTPTFRIGARDSTAANFYAGTAEQAFFHNPSSGAAGAAMTDADIAKMAAYRYDHNTGTLSSNQRWNAKVYPNAGEPAYQPGAQWLVSANDTNSVFWDFSDLAATDAVDIYLEDIGISPFVIPSVGPFDQTYTSALPSSVAHGQPDIPEVVILVETGVAGEWAPVTSEGKVKVDGTNITFLDTMPVPAASPNRVWVLARTRRSAAAAVPTASTSRAGVLTVIPPTISKFTTGSGTYTVPAGVAWLRLRMVGGGGGGGGSGSAAFGSGGAGGSTTFGLSTCTAGSGGGNGTSATSGGSAGTATLGTGAAGIGAAGSSGSAASGGGTAVNFNLGAAGGASPLGGAGGWVDNQAGQTAAPNSGSGGSGGGMGSTVGGGGCGGGSGGYIDAVIAAPAATYSYAVGTGGTAGTAGTNGTAGGGGAAGIIVIEEHYY